MNPPPANPRALSPWDGTVPALRQGLARDPDNGELRRLLARTLAAQGRYPEAMDQARLLLEKDPGDEGARLLLAWGALGQGDPDPEGGSTLSASSCEELAGRAADLGQWEAASELLARVCALRPRDPQAVLKHAIALDYTGRFQAALDGLRGLEDRIPDDPRVRAQAGFHRACTRLLHGDLAEGFRLMEARLDLAAPRAMPLQRWQGQDLSGRKILLRAEQGFGDLFMFVRYAPLLAARGAQVYLEPFFSAQSVLATCPGIAGILEGTVSVPGDMLQVELLSLPHLCGTGPGTIPAAIPYLSVPDRVPNREGLAQAIRGPGRRLGLVWSGNPGHPRTRERNIPPEILELLGEVPGITWFSLQKGDHARPDLPMVDLGPLLSDYADTAFALSRLDGLISVDTGIVHLAGALGRPTWVLLAHLPDWRWMLEGTTSPWYPTLTLWRQEAHWDWPGVAARVAEALRKPGENPFRDGPEPTPARPGSSGSLPPAP